MRLPVIIINDCWEYIIELEVINIVIVSNVTGIIVAVELRPSHSFTDCPAFGSESELSDINE